MRRALSPKTFLVRVAVGSVCQQPNNAPRATLTADDDLSASGGHLHFDAGVAVFGQLTVQELVELRIEDPIGHELQWATRRESWAAKEPREAARANKEANKKTLINHACE